MSIIFRAVVLFIEFHEIRKLIHIDVSGTRLTLSNNATATASGGQLSRYLDNELENKKLS